MYVLKKKSNGEGIVDEEEEEEGRGRGKGKKGAGAQDRDRETDKEDRPRGSKFDYETLTDENGQVWSGVIIDHDLVSHTLPRERYVCMYCMYIYMAYECMYVCMYVCMLYLWMYVLRKYDS